MKIEVNKRYINAKGDVIVITGYNPTAFYPFNCKHYSYTTQGYRIQNQECLQDLICEVVPFIEDLFARNSITQKEFIKKHIEYWTKNEQTNL